MPKKRYKKPTVCEYCGKEINKHDDILTVKYSVVLHEKGLPKQKYKATLCSGCSHILKMMTRDIETYYSRMKKNDEYRENYQKALERLRNEGK